MSTRRRTAKPAVRTRKTATQDLGSSRSPSSEGHWEQLFDDMADAEESEAVVAEETTAQEVVPEPARRTRSRRSTVAAVPAVAPEIPEILSGVLIVDAAQAHLLLKGQAPNRRIRASRVTEFARDMANGDWEMTGEAIKLNPAGDLLDGQHRLLAVLKADEMMPGIGVPMLVVRNVLNKAQRVMDTNTRRTAADQFKIAGYTYAAALAAAAKWAIIWDRQALYSGKDSRNVTHSEQLSFTANNPRLQEIVKQAASKSKYIHMPLGYVACGWWVLDRIDEDQAEWFFDRLGDGANMPSDHPIMALRNTLIQLRLQKSNMSGEVHLGLLMRTWNAMRLGKSLGKIPLYKEGRPIRCPMPL